MINLYDCNIDKYNYDTSPTIDVNYSFAISKYSSYGPVNYVYYFRNPFRRHFVYAG